MDRVYEIYPVQRTQSRIIFEITNAFHFWNGGIA
jgi:hypothetical protein